MIRWGRSDGNYVCHNCQRSLEEGERVLWMMHIGEGCKCRDCISDTERMIAELQVAGDRGVHTFDFRSAGISGNPSQRATDAERNYGVRIDRVWEERNGRRGKRFFLLVGLETGNSPGGAAPSLESGESSVGQLPAISADQGARPSSPAADAAPPDLFSVPKRSSMYETWEDVA